MLGGDIGKRKKELMKKRKAMKGRGLSLEEST